MLAVAPFILDRRTEKVQTNVRRLSYSIITFAFVLPCVTCFMYLGIIDIDSDVKDNQMVLLIVAVIEITAIVFLYTLVVFFMLIFSSHHVRLLNDLDSLDSNLNRIGSTTAKAMSTVLCIRRLKRQTLCFVVGHALMTGAADWLQEYSSVVSYCGVFMFITIDVQMLHVRNVVALMAHLAGRIQTHLDACLNGDSDGQIVASIQWQRHNVNDQIAAMDDLWRLKCQFQTLFGGYLMLQFECDFMIVLAVSFILLYFVDREIPNVVLGFVVAVHIVRVALKYFWLVMASVECVDKVGVCLEF